MTPFSEILKRTFGSAPPAPPQPLPVAPTPAPAKPAGKSMDIESVAEAQRIYNPGLPPTPPKVPMPKTDQGTAANMDVAGTWGAPEAKS